MKVEGLNMDTYKESLEYVYSQVAPEVDELYKYYRKKKGLEEEKDTEKQLEILTIKKYISNSFIADLSLIIDYYERGMISMYLSKLQEYKTRIRFLLDI